MKLFHILAAGAVLGSQPLAAQDVPDIGEEGPPNRESVFDGDWFAVGFGGVYSAEYDGADEYQFTPIPVLAAEIGGVVISPRAAGFAIGLIEEDIGNVEFSAGPTIRFRGDRTGSIDDPVVAAAGELDTAIEIGPTASLTINDIFSSFDRISIGLTVKWDVAGAHSGVSGGPSLSYFTPLSRGSIMVVSTSAQYVDGNYGDYYFSVSPEQSAASGLPEFEADGGWKKAGLRVALGFDLDGNFDNGGIVMGVSTGYSRMLGDAADTPYTSLRGDADQFVALAGVAYVF